MRRLFALGVLLAALLPIGAASPARADIEVCADALINLTGTPIYVQDGECLMLPLATVPPPWVNTLLGGSVVASRPTESGAGVCLAIKGGVPSLPIPLDQAQCFDVPLPGLPPGTIPSLPPAPPIGLPPIPPPIPPNIPGVPPIPLPGIPGLPTLPV